jgi:hypothetical protein
MAIAPGGWRFDLGLTLEALLPDVSRDKVHGRTGRKESKKGGRREEGGRRRELGRKETKSAYHVVVLLNFPYLHLSSTTTLCTHVYVYRRCGCWCCYGRMGIGRGCVHGMGPGLGIGIDIDDHRSRSVRWPPSLLAAVEALAGKSEEQRAR